MSEPMSERRKGQHSAVHRLAQVFADLVLAEQDVKELDERSGKKTRALCFIRNSSAVIQRVIDTDLGPKLIDNEEKKKKKGACMPEMKFIDPMDLPAPEDLIFVLVDDRVGALGWFIKWWSKGQIKDHESGNYNHAMLMRTKGKVVTQANVFKEISAEVYKKPTIFLKFWRVKNLSLSDFATINAAIDKKLSQPWWRRMYDFVGLIGQSTAFTHWLQIPGLWFCSESGSDLARLSKTMYWMPKQPSPSGLDEAFKAHSDDMEVVGYWFSI